MKSFEQFLDESSLPELKKHPMWSDDDYHYLKGKGYDHKEIKSLWDRDHKAGNDPVHHPKNFPDVVGVVSNPNFYKGK